LCIFEKLSPGLFAKSKQKSRRRTMQKLKKIIQTLMRGFKSYLNIFKLRLDFKLRIIQATTSLTIRS
jgi:hypothetical protein